MATYNWRQPYDELSSASGAIAVLIVASCYTETGISSGWIDDPLGV